MDNVSKSRWANMDGARQPTTNDQLETIAKVGAVVDTRRLLSYREDDANANYLQCYYNDMAKPVLCEKQLGCCDTGCCGNEGDWMAGIYVLIAFVIVTVVVGFVTAIVCYQRSKNKSKKEQAYEQYARSQYTAYPYHYPSQIPGNSRATNFTTPY